MPHLSELWIAKHTAIDINPSKHYLIHLQSIAYLQNATKHPQQITKGKVPKPFIKITSGSIASNKPSTTHRYHTHNSRRRRTCVACALLKKKAFWKPQHKKSFFSPHKIHLSDKPTKLSNPPRSPTLDRKKEPTWLKNSWVDRNITKRVGKLKSTHKKEGQIIFLLGYNNTHL
jgi:hypothetical protein